MKGKKLIRHCFVAAKCRTCVAFEKKIINTRSEIYWVNGFGVLLEIEK